MSRSTRRCLAFVSVLALLCSAATPAVATPPDGRLEGRVVGPDGRPATGYGVLLIDDAGAVRGRAITSDEGLYHFPAVAPGAYGLGLETPEGGAAPVMAPATEISAGQLVRRDVKLIAAEEIGPLPSDRVHHGLGIWWAGLSPAAKVAVVVGGLVLLGIGIEELDDDDQGQAVSPFRLE